MFINTFRNFFVLLSAIYAFYKLLNLRFTQNQRYLYAISSLTISCICSYVFFNFSSLNWPLLFLSFLLLIKCTTKLNTTVLYTASIFSFTLSSFALNLSSIIVAIILSPFYYGNYDMPWFFLHACFWILQVLLLFGCFRIPRLRKGMTFLYNLSSNNIGSSVCFIAIASVIIASQSKTYDRQIILTFSTALFISGFLLIYWWNYHITQTYRKFLRKNELDSLNLLLEERKQKILYLKNQNDELARLIHKDNKIIPAITSAIMESYENKMLLDLSEWETDSPLCLKLKQLYNERVDMLETYHNEIMNLPKTSFDSINATISFMHSEASKTDIPFQVVLYDNLKTTIPNEIIEDDFNHMLSDLLINAINACKDITSGSIQIYLGKTEEISIIKICNTGSIFHLETLNNLGLARHTTHAETGGSGIGLMDIWKIKEKYKATLLIDEIADASSSETYTCMNVLFNRKNHFMIQSDRSKELITYINRPDVMIISKD